MSIALSTQQTVMELTAPEAWCSFYESLPASVIHNAKMSERFGARIVVTVFEQHWWFGTAEVAVTVEDLRRFAANGRIVARIECYGFVGDVIVPSFLVIDDIAVLRFVGITKPPGP